MQNVRTAKFLVLAVFLAAGTLWGQEAHAPKTLAQALDLAYEGSTLRELLSEPRTPYPRRYGLDAVIAFRTTLGKSGAKWIAKAVEAGIPPSAAQGLDILDVDLDAARHAEAYLVNWTKEAEGKLISFRVSRILIQSGSSNAEALRVLRMGVSSKRTEFFSVTISHLMALGNRASMFTEALLARIERGASEKRLASSSVVSCLYILQGITEPVSRKHLDRVLRLLDRRDLPRAEVLRLVANQGTSALPALPSLLKAARDPGPIDRAAAARALGATGSRQPAVVGALRRLSKDSDRRVREAAERALGSLGF